MKRWLEMSVGRQSGHLSSLEIGCRIDAGQGTSGFQDEGSPGSRLDPHDLSQASTKTGSLGASDRDRGSDSRLGVEVVFATRGRASIVAEGVKALDRQVLPPCAITLSCNAFADAGDLAGRSDIRVLVGGEGLAHQRNQALQDPAPGTEIVVFFDDDFLPHAAWIEAVERRFRIDENVVAITGNVVADGIKGPGFSFEQAAAILDEREGRRSDPDLEAYSPYGCNMAFRRSAIAGLAFDERLVLYGWLEDRDFGGALAKRGGRSIKLGEALGVHLGVKAGRLSGRRLGYSQIVNPVYLRQKGTLTTSSLVWHVFKNLASNAALSMHPEPYVDRIGRLCGNARGAAELVLGRARPERALLL